MGKPREASEVISKEKLIRKHKHDEWNSDTAMGESKQILEELKQEIMEEEQ